METIEKERLVKTEWDVATRLLQDAQRVILVTHVRPDGDAMGSMCGLGLALRDHGKDVTMAVDGGTTAYLSYVPGSDTVVTALENPQADLVIACDAAGLERAGVVGQAAFDLGTPTIVLDHHATNTLFGAVHLVDEDFVSTCEVVLRWLDYLGWELTTPVATALLVGFVTDTISFRVGPVTPETLDQVRRLMTAGAPLQEVIERMLVRSEPGQLKLMGIGLANMELQNHVAWAALRLDDFKRLGLSTASKPELSTELLREPDAFIACFFLETEEGDVRLSFRAVAGFDVGSIAFALGGGGHTQAAGATLMNTSLEAAVEKVVPLLKAEIQRGSASA